MTTTTIQGPATRARLLAAAAGAFATLLALAPGCGGGPEMARVSGKVSSKGKALDQGNVSFVPVGTPERPPASGKIGPDGTYSLQTADGLAGAQLGEYQVAVTGSDPDAPNQDIPGMPIKSKSAVPAKYADPAKSGLTATVKGGSNTINLNVD